MAIPSIGKSKTYFDSLGRASRALIEWNDRADADCRNAVWTPGRTARRTSATEATANQGRACGERRLAALNVGRPPVDVVHLGPGLVLLQHADDLLVPETLVPLGSSSSSIQRRKIPARNDPDTAGKGERNGTAARPERHSRHARHGTFVPTPSMSGGKPRKSGGLASPVIVMSFL